MKKCSILFILLVFTLASCQNNNKNLIAQAEWLLGTWEDKEDVLCNSYEVWKKVNDTVFVWNSYALNDKNTIISEAMAQLIQWQDSLFYIVFAPLIGSDLPINFLLTSSSKDVLLFKNLNKGYWQEISYRKIDSDSFVIRYIHVYDGSREMMEVPYKKRK